MNACRRRTRVAVSAAAVLAIVAGPLRAQEERPQDPAGVTDADAVAEKSANDEDASRSGYWEIGGFIGLLNDEPEYHPDDFSDQFKRSALIGARGGYTLVDTSGQPDVILVATGSEVALAVSAAAALEGDGIAARVVSLPSTDVFDAQDAAWRESVLPAAITARVVIEAGVTETWWRYAGPAGRVIGLDEFGQSAPADQLFEHYGFSTANVVAAAKSVI